MSAYAYRCVVCKGEIELHEPRDRVWWEHEPCGLTEHKRVWSVSVNRENIRAVPRS